jgi:hypothetical protein
MKRILIVVNKWWECDPVLSALLNANALPQGFPWPNSSQPPRPRPQKPPEFDPNPKPRAVFTFEQSAVEVWCISDVLEDLPKNLQSSSEMKAKRLPLIFEGKKPDLVIAVGTAGFPSDISENGSVTVGTSIFMHDGHPNGSNPDSKWNGPFDKLLTSSLTRDQFAQITNLDATVATKFLPVPLNPSAKARVIASYDSVALDTVNVTQDSEYAALDPQTLAAFKASGATATPVSVETTHGIIRAQSNAPFIFVSAIVNRLGHFVDETAPRFFPQNTAAAINAGVVLGWMLPNIAKTV